MLRLSTLFLLHLFVVCVCTHVPQHVEIRDTLLLHCGFQGSSPCHPYLLTCLPWFLKQWLALSWEITGMVRLPGQPAPSTFRFPPSEHWWEVYNAQFWQLLRIWIQVFMFTQQRLPNWTISSPQKQCVSKHIVWKIFLSLGDNFNSKLFSYLSK